MVDGSNTGIKHSYVITEDKFAIGDNALSTISNILFAIAYAYNQFKKYDPMKSPTLTDRRNLT